MCECGDTTTGKFLSKVASRGGDMLQRFAIKKFKAFTGLGDYTIRSNTLIKGNAGGGPTGDAVVRMTANGIEVIHSEYLGNVSTHPTVVGGFWGNSYNINPGLVTSFPWLSTIATQYEQWIPMGIIYEFKTTSTTYSTNPSLGSVIMATEYDASESNGFNTKAEMLQSAYSNEAVVSMSQVHGIECDPSQNPNMIYYVRQEGAVVGIGNEDIKDYDLGIFEIATQGGTLAAAATVGDLWVHYHIRFIKPQMFGGIPNRTQIFTLFRGTLTQQDNWSQLPITAGYDLGITYNNSTKLWTIPKKYSGAVFRFCFSYNNNAGTAYTLTLPATNVLVNCNLVGPSLGSGDVSGINTLAPEATVSSLRHDWSYAIGVGSDIYSDATVGWSSATMTPASPHASNQTAVYIYWCPDRYWFANGVLH